MKRNALIVFIVVIVTLSAIALLRVNFPTNSPIGIEVTVAYPVTKQIGTSNYRFKLYPYPLGSEELTGLYMLRVEKGNDFETEVVMSGNTYKLLDLEVYVVKLISAGVLLQVKLAE